jgi:hypothetical protein
MAHIGDLLLQKVLQKRFLALPVIAQNIVYCSNGVAKVTSMKSMTYLQFCNDCNRLLQQTLQSGATVAKIAFTYSKRYFATPQFCNTDMVEK